MLFLKKYWYFVVILVLIIILLIVRAMNAQAPSNSQQAAADLSKLHSDPQKRTISDDNATLIAQQLLAAMDQYGTDEDSIVRLLTPLNHDDLILVIQKFGIKPYNGVGLATRWEELKFFSNDLNLQGWLNEELSGSYLATVKQIFANNNIAF